MPNEDLKIKVNKRSSPRTSRNIIQTAHKFLHQGIRIEDPSHHKTAANISGN